MSELVIRNRHRLRNKIIKEFARMINDYYSLASSLEGSLVDEAKVNGKNILIIGNEIISILIENTPILTVKGLLKYRPESKFVTVDMGAIKFILNGADIMAPGIVDADNSVQVDDIVWVRDEKNLKPLAIGQALMTGQEMVDNNSQRAIKSIHYVNDKLWNLKV